MIKEINFEREIEREELKERALERHLEKERENLRKQGQKLSIKNVRLGCNKSNRNLYFLNFKNNGKTYTRKDVKKKVVKT